MAATIRSTGLRPSPAGIWPRRRTDRRYFRHTRLRAARQQLEFRWSEWEGQHGERLGANGTRRADELSPKLAGALAVLPPEGLTAKQWERAAGLPVGTFYYCRDSLVEHGRVTKQGEGRGALFRPIAWKPTSQ